MRFARVAVTSVLATGSEEERDKIQPPENLPDSISISQALPCRSTGSPAISASYLQPLLVRLKALTGVRACASTILAAARCVLMAGVFSTVIAREPLESWFAIVC